MAQRRFIVSAAALLATLVLELGALSCAPPVRGIQPAADFTENALSKNSATEALPALPLPIGRVVSFERELEKVSDSRSLVAPQKIAGLEVEIGELLAHVERMVDLETPTHALQGTEEMLVALGVVPLNFQYRETLLRLLRAQLAGLYDPHLKVMLIRKELDESARKMTLLHELVHALQDQNFDLDEVVKWTPDDTDRSSALSALAEGDATSAMFDGVLPKGQTAISLPAGTIQESIMASARGSESADEIPNIIKSSLRAPYLDGITFVHRLRRRGGWNEVNRVWKTPPQTTEQILHLDKYDALEAALSVRLIGPPEQEGWKVLLQDVWGEQSLALVFGDWMERSLAYQRASGWGGDRVVVYEKEETRAFAWHIRADDRQSAEKMYRTFSDQLANNDLRDRVKALSKPGAVTESEKICGSVNSSSTSPYLAVAIWGDHILLTSAPYERGVKKMGSCELASGWIDTQLRLLFPE